MTTAPTPEAEISVVIVTYYAGPSLFDTLAVILESPEVREVILVNNGSSQADLAALQKAEAHHDHLRLISGHGNVGFAAGCNRGAKAAQGTFLMFLNPDAIPKPEALKRLRDECMKMARPALVGARILHPDGREQRGGRRGELTLLGAMVVMLRLGRFFESTGHRFKIHREDEPLPKGPVDMPTISGAAFMIRAADYRDLCGMDEGFFFHVDDFDLCRRVRDAGGRVRFHPLAEVTHLGATSAVSPLFVEWHKGKGLVRFFLKHTRSPLGKLAALALAPLIIGLSVARPLVRRALGRKTPPPSTA